MSSLEFNSVGKSYGATPVLHDVNFSIERGEFVVFVGPSGCGKSTLLRMIAGLEDITAGEIALDGEVINEVQPADRGIAMVFQSYALYPHMTVRENMGFGLRMSKVAKPEIERRVLGAAEMLQITPLLDRFPKQLSGGQRQRVAIGRAITRDPKVFLFDEPLSNLDAALRVATRIEIAKLKQRMPNTTMIYVTHDQVEAMTLANRIVVLHGGCVEQIGSPEELYMRPANTFVAGFIGSPAMNFFEAMVEQRAGGLAGRTGKDAAFALPTGSAAALGERCIIGVRPEDLVITDGDHLVSGTISVIENLGDHLLAYLDAGLESPVVAKLPIDHSPGIGQLMRLAPSSLAKMHLFGADGRRLES
jgi:ABC-type sugar transport system ATPase subunit